jgi:hypothetical protein
MHFVLLSVLEGQHSIAKMSRTSYRPRLQVLHHRLESLGSVVMLLVLLK